MSEYDIGTLDCAWVGGTRYRIVEPETGETVVVDIKDATITYDHAFNHQGDTPDHSFGTAALVKATVVADSRPEMDMELLREGIDLLSRARPPADNGAPQNASESPQSDAQREVADAELADADDSADALVAKVRTWLEDNDVPVGDGVSVYAHDEYDSVQIDKNDYMDGGWDELMSCVSHEAVKNAPDDYLWYVAFEDVNEVVSE